MSGTDYNRTPNYSLFKPIPTHDIDLWGDHWNNNADIIDTTMKTFVSLSGGTMQGALALVGVSTALTAAPGANTTQIASTAFVTGAVGTATAGAPFLPLAGGAVGPLTLNSTLSMGSSIVRWGILPLAAGAPTTGGSGYVAGEVITLTGGATISVQTLGAGGAVALFMVQQPGSYTTVPTGPLAQTGTTGAGTGCTITPPFGPIAASIGAVGLVGGGNGNYIQGYQAGIAVTTGSEATLVGAYAGTKMTSGAFNTAFGHRALGLETTGTGLTAIGNDAMRNTNGLTNGTAVGGSAHRAWVGSYSTAIGSGALQGNEDGVSSVGGSNIAIGVSALHGLTATTANNNIVIGNSAAQVITTGNANIVIGNGAGIVITTAQQNVMIGSNAGGAVVSAFEDVFIGFNAAKSATGSTNTVIGHTSAIALTSGSGNTIVGAHAGNKLTTGGANTIIGANVASTTLSTGGSNIVIGVNSKADTPAAGSIDTLTIQGNGATAAISGTNLSGTPNITIPGNFVVGGATTLPTLTVTNQVTAGGGVNLSSAVPAWRLYNDGRYLHQDFSATHSWTWDTTNHDYVYTTSGGSNLFFSHSDWSAVNFAGAVGGVGAFVVVSDERSKRDIAPAGHGLDAILGIEPVIYHRWNPVTKTRHEHAEIGFGARQIRTVLPEAVVEMAAPDDAWRELVGGDTVLGVRIDPIVAALVNCVKTLNARLVAMEDDHADKRR